MKLPFSFIIVIMSTAIAKCIASCGNRVCLSWSVEEENVKIVCNITNMKYNIELTDPLNNTVGLCTPFTCNNIQRSRLLNETILIYTLRSDSTNVNGTWHCLHGRNRDNASVVITAQQTATRDKNATTATLGNKDNALSILECVFLETASSAFGFGGVCLIVCVVVVSCQKCQLTIEPRRVRISLTIVLCLLFFMMPLVLGVAVSDCDAYGATSAWGVAIGIGCSLTFTKRKDCQQDKKRDDATAQPKDEITEMMPSTDSIGDTD